MDAAQWDQSQHAVLLSQANGPINGLRLKVETWTGGFYPPGRLVDGWFK